MEVALEQDRAREPVADTVGTSETDSLLSARKGLMQQVLPLTELRALRFVWDLGAQWIVIGVAAAWALWWGHVLGYAIAALVIATRQHALGILMHDGTHYRLLPSRAWNDAVCDFLCALPLGMTTNRYRHEHLLHHRYLNTDRDPYWVDFEKDAEWHWPKRPKAALAVALRDITQVNGRRWGAVMYRWSPWINHFSVKALPSGTPALGSGERIRIYVFHLAVAAGVLFTPVGWKLLALWLVPLLAVTPLLVRVRTIAEHLAIPNRSELDASRHSDGTWLERQTVAPLGINYHLDHHLFPAVPYYNLPALHALLMSNGDYRRGAILNRRYFGFGPDDLLGQIIRRER